LMVGTRVASVSSSNPLHAAPSRSGYEG
jgi:hypothetical protein